MQTKTYQLDDLAACLALYDSNDSIYFDPSERQHYVDFLQLNAVENNYLLLFDADQLVACGGYGLINGKIHLRWGMVNNQLHGKGLGSQLLLARLKAIQSKLGQVAVYIETSVQAAGFYQRYGFVTSKVVADHYGKGFDQHSMCLEDWSMVKL